MTGSGYRDPTAGHIVSLQALAGVLAGVLAVVARIESPYAQMLILRYGLVDGIPRSASEVGRLLRLPGSHVEALGARLLTMPALREALREYLDTDWRNIPLDARARLVGIEPATQVMCPRHGSRLIPPTVPDTCAVCPCPIFREDAVGRPRRYCSGACRQEAYRRRCAAASDSTAAA